MNNRIGLLCAMMGCALIPPAAFAVDGVVLINQATALAGNVTPGDTAGFPVTISQPGSYRLSSNLTVPDANVNAIEVTGDNVTIDLNGFAIIGPVVCVGTPVTSCSPSANGVGITSSLNMTVTVMNGTVRGMRLGIQMNGPSRIERVNAVGNGSIGILSQAGSAVVVSSIANRNGGAGFSIPSNSNIITGNVAFGNLADGFFVQGVASGNSAFQNGRTGMIGSGTFTGNDVLDNGTVGISVTCPSSVIGNRSFANQGANISTSFPGCVVSNNAAP